jgi:phage antirepressor YoqD-like protein
MHTTTTSINSQADSSSSLRAANLTRQVMSTREIADLTGKLHKNVKRDVVSMLAELNIDALSFERIYVDGQNRSQTEYLLDREHTDCLLTGYSAPMRMKVIRRWHELEGRVVGQLQVPTNFLEAMRLATQQAEQNEQLQAVIDRQAPKVAAIQRLAGAGGAICITDAAKQLQVPPSKLFDWLQANRWIFRRGSTGRWVAHQPRITNGLMKHKVTALKPDPETGIERAAFDPLITPKGLATLAERLTGAAL